MDNDWTYTFEGFRLNNWGLEKYYKEKEQQNICILN